MSEIKLTADGGGGSVSLKGPATTTGNAGVNLKLPVADGSANQVLKTDGSGQLSFTTITDTDTDTLSFRNVIQNGAAKVAQRWTSKTGLTTSNWIVDRFKMDAGSIGTYTISQDSSGPPGFANSMKVLLTSAATLGASSLAQIMIALEGQDLQRFCKGTSSAKKFAMSFWVKAKVTGTYVCELYDQDNTRQTSKQYSISSADTWEKKTIIFDADTTGAFDDDAAASLIIYWKLAAGSNWTSGTLQTSWAANTNANRAVGQVNGMATNNDYFQLTGVQLEAGDTATDFEHRSFSDELWTCRRYCQVSKGDDNDFLFGPGYEGGSGSFYLPMMLNPPMRAHPSMKVESGDWKQVGQAGQSTNYTAAMAAYDPQPGPIYTSMLFWKDTDYPGSKDGRTQWMRADSDGTVVAIEAEL